jgi:DUF4097 and DUF4098 domain-containing protein YvlB
MIRYAATLLFAYSAVVLGSSEEMHRVNGSVSVDPGQQVGDVSTVNGSINVGGRARVDGAETVNGSIRLDAGAAARAVETVNGSITIGEDATVTEGVEAVNGKVRLARGARVGGALENVNGEFRIEGAFVGGGIRTMNGDIHVGTGSRVEGGIHVEKTQGRNWPWQGREDPPRITIESGAVVTGPLRFEREVDLHVGEGVTLGPVSGIEPRRHALP